MFASGRASIALRWLDRLPSSVRLDNTIVALEHAALLTMTGGTVFAEETIEQLCRTRELSRGEQVVVDAIRCTWVQSHSPPEHVLTASDAVLGALDTVLPCDLPDVLGISSHDSLRDIAIACRARALWHRGETSEARAALEHLVDAGIEFPPWRISAIGALALLEAWSGRLESAHEYAQDAIRLARLHDLVLHPSTIDSLLAMGHVLRERGAFDRAALVLDEAHTIAASIRRSASLAVHTVEAALLELGLGRPRAGLDRLASFAAAGHREPWPAITSRLCAVEARLYLAAGESHITERVLRDRPPSAAISRARVELAVAAGDLSSARSVLEGWPERHDICSELDRRLWRAVVEDLDGRRAAAVQAIRLALALGEPDGHVQAFLDAGPDVRRILRYVVRSWPTHYVAMLLDLADLTTRLRSNPVHGEVTLSDRELVVLQYLPSRMSNAEIARHLYVSRNTVKSHLRSIYRSLGVTSRRDAVDRGAELGLL
jgi:LuxR family maltose regulon positive regulatory protein